MDCMRNLPRPPKTGWRIRRAESVEIAAANSPTAVLKGPQSSSVESLRSRFREWQKERSGFSTAKYANHANPPSPGYGGQATPLLAGLRRAGRSSTLRSAGKTLTRLETVQHSELGVNGALQKTTKNQH
jgi:hypothetical protein